MLQCEGEGSFLVSLVVAGAMAGTAVDFSLPMGSAPNAAVFFLNYDMVKRAAVGRGVADTAILHLASFSLSEVITSCPPW